jgi:hypothetical protein
MSSRAAVQTLPQMTLPEVPIEKWLSPKELAGCFGLKEDSAEAWIHNGIVPRRYVKFCGRRRMRIHPAIVEKLEEDFEAAHDR